MLAFNRRLADTGVVRRIHLEVHAQRLRLRDCGQYSHHIPNRMGQSKIPGYAVRVSVPKLRGFSALVVISSVAARFFLPQVAGLRIIPPAAGQSFRIDHDEKYNQTTHFQYQPWKTGPWFGFNWRYDSGLVARGRLRAYGGNCAEHHD